MHELVITWMVFIFDTAELQCIKQRRGDRQTTVHLKTYGLSSSFLFVLGMHYHHVYKRQQAQWSGLREQLLKVDA